MNLPPEVVSRYSAELAHMTQRLEELLQSQRQFEIEFVAASTERSALECPKIQHVCQDMSLLHCDAGVNGESDYRGASPEDSLELSGECGDRWSGAGRGMMNRQESVFSSSGDFQNLIPPMLPEEWPRCLQPRPELRKSEYPGVSICTTSHSSPASGRRQDVTQLRSEHRWSFQALDPNTPIAVVVDVVGALVLVVDLTQIPYMIAWNVPVEGGYKYLFWFMVLYWTLDMGRAFLTGYTSNGEVELRLRAVSLRYLRTWFAVDFAIVLCDWMSVLTSFVADLSTDSSSVRVLRIAKVSRLVRILALFRFFRMCRFFEEFTDKFLSGGMRVLANTMAIFLVVIWLNHFVWVSIGSWESDTGRQWIWPYENAHFSYLYTTSFHWSMAQMTLGATEVVATNTAERIMNIVMLLIGLVFSSTLVSSLSATLIGYQMQSSAVRDQMRCLRQFLRERDVHPALAYRVKQQAEHRINFKAALLEDGVSALRVLSPSLLSEMRDEVYAPVLETHPLFSSWSKFSPSTMREFTDTINDFSFHTPPDDIFFAGHTCDNAFYLAKGTLTYLQCPESSIALERTERSVEPNTWLCEASLWSEWIHVGSAQATSSCQLLGVQGSMVMSVASKHRFICRMTQQYGRQFHKCVITARPPNQWPDDLHVPFTDWVDIVCSMDSSVRTAISLDALTHMSPPHIVTAKKWVFARDQLKEEVMDGRSTVILNAKGHAERIVSVTALLIEADDQRFLAQIAKWEGQPGSAIRPIVQLPGSAQEFRELPYDAARRILRTKFQADDALVQALSSEREVSYKESQMYRVQTKYVRAVFRVTLVGPLHMPAYRVKASAADVEEPLPKHRRFSYRRPSVPYSRSRSSLSMRRPSLTSTCEANHMSMAHILGENYREREVLVLRRPEKLVFYLWVTQSEFACLQEPEHGNLICKWLRTLDMDPSILEKVRSETSSSEV